MSKTAQLTIDLINAINESLRIVKDIRPFQVTIDEQPSVYEFAEANLVSALAYIVQPFTPNTENGPSKTTWHYADENGNPVTADEYAAHVANATP